MNEAELQNIDGEGETVHGKAEDSGCGSGFLKRPARLVYFGTPEFAVPPLHALAADPLVEVLCVVSQPDKPQGRRQIVEATAVKAAAAKLGFTVSQPRRLRDGALARELFALKPDIFITCAYGRILPEDILALPTLGAFNLHGSLLPKYRGASPLQWTLINGDSETGVTLIAMDEEMDHGPIYAQSHLDISEIMDLPTLSRYLSYQAAELLRERLPAILSGEAKGLAQDEAEASYVRLLSREDGRIDWKRSSRQIHNLVRGTYPWPGASTLWRGKALKILRAAAVDPAEIALSSLPFNEELKRAEPGMLLKIEDKRRLFVSCGVRGEQTVLELLEIQLAGGKKLPVALCAHNYPAGERLGDVEAFGDGEPE